MDNIKVTMTLKEIKRVEVMKLIERGAITGKQASEMLGISLRQTRRLLQRYRSGGATSLIHGNRGKPSPHQLDREIVITVQELLREQYSDYNTQHLVEVLAERHAIHLSASSLTRIRRAAGYPTPRHKKRRQYHARRERKAMRGQMLQADASIHNWLEGRGRRLALIAYIDDATSQVYATFREQEDAAGYMQVLQEICLKEGIPQTIYMDKRLASRGNTSQRQSLAEKQPLSQFERLLEKLGVELILAHSPQAKGRVERLFDTLQDRLVKALREAEASDLSTANAVLKIFLSKFNHQFMVNARQNESAYVPWDMSLDPDIFFVFKYTRIVKNDNTISFDNHILQLPSPTDRSSYAKAKVTLLHHLDGRLTVHYHHTQIACFQAVPDIPLQVGKFTPAQDYSYKQFPNSDTHKEQKHKKDKPTYSPGPNHPWKQSYGHHLNGRLIQKDSADAA
jgi:transposase